MMYTDNRRFEWDIAKARGNSLKHDVGFREAETAFDDPEYFLTDDLAHSKKEARYWLIGETSAARLIVVVFTIRTRGAVRIISAREATEYEKEKYEDNR